MWVKSWCTDVAVIEYLILLHRFLLKGCKLRVEQMRVGYRLVSCGLLNLCVVSVIRVDDTIEEDTNGRCEM
jgi:hypothetical protein